MPEIHSTAIVDPGAMLADDVVVGPWSVIGADVSIDAGTVIGPHTRIQGITRIGRNNRIVGQCSIGTDPQDLKFHGERTELIIGSDNMIREFVTINRGTPGGGGRSSVGDHCLLMAYSHIAHDCHVGSHVIFANNGTLAGHVQVGSYSTIGAFSAIHQFCRVGEHAFIGGATIATQDVLPFIKTVGSRPAKTYGVNTLGLERKGFTKETIEGLQRAYRLLVRSKLRLEPALERIEAELAGITEVERLTKFVRSASSRGFIR